MTPRQLIVLLLVAGSSMVWGADPNEGLAKARSQYREAVSAHGPKSPEARNARMKLRTARHAFHADRRAHQIHRQHAP